MRVKGWVRWGLVAGLSFGPACDDDCSSPRDCPSGQTCVAGQCTGRGDTGDLDLRERPTVPEVEPGPTQDAEAGTPPVPDATAPDADAGPPSDAVLSGQVFVHQFRQSPVASEADIRGRIVNIQGAGRTATATAVGGCQLVETTFQSPPVGVQIGGVEVTVSQTNAETYALTSLSDGSLVPPPTLPDQLFPTAARGTVSFSLDGGSGTGKPLGFEADLPGPSPLTVLSPSPLAPLPVGGGVTFTFTPIPIQGDLLRIRMADTVGADDLDQLELICEPLGLPGGTFVLSPVAVQAFVDAGPEGSVTLTFAYRESQTQITDVTGGGRAVIELEVLRGARFDVLLP